MKRLVGVQIFFITVFLSIYVLGCKKNEDLQRPITNDLDSIFEYLPHDIAKGVSLGNIYETIDFAAFTDLVIFNKEWFAVFRVGTKHVGGTDGQIKIVHSIDGIHWKVFQIISRAGYDLRDPKFTLDTLSSHLMINFFGTNKRNSDRINFIVDYNQQTHAWDKIEEMNIEDSDKNNLIFWRLTQNRDKVYCAAYRVPTSDDDNNIYLYESSRNYRRYKRIGPLNLGDNANETTIRFGSDDKMYFIARTENANSPIGISQPPYYDKVNWIKNELLTRISSPNFLIYNDLLLITGRDGTTGILKLLVFNLNSRKIEKNFSFPFAGIETGYAGMSFNPDNSNELWISYYSIEKAKSVISLAKVSLLSFI